MTRPLAALVLSASTIASAMPTAVERGAAPRRLPIQRTIVLDETLKTEGGDTLSKGPYDVRFELLPGNKARATFFQGGVKRGEAQGTVLHADALMEDFGIYYFFRHGDGKHQLVVGKPGANQIMIDLVSPPGPAPTKTPVRR